jgi:hypothetical protein
MESSKFISSASCTLFWVHEIYDLREMLKKEQGANFKLNSSMKNFLVMAASGKIHKRTDAKRVLKNN